MYSRRKQPQSIPIRQRHLVPPSSGSAISTRRSSQRESALNEDIPHQTEFTQHRSRDGIVGGSRRFQRLLEAGKHRVYQQGRFNQGYQESMTERTTGEVYFAARML
jgi:hypothetical protein